MINRLTAYKVWISDIINNAYIKTTGEFESNYVEIKDKQVSRVNIIATIVNKSESEDKNYISITLDDSSEQVRVKTWSENTKLLDKFNVGDTILIIGKVKDYNNEIYIVPEIAKLINIDWEIIRKLELTKIYGKPIEHKVFQEAVEEPTLIEEINFSSNNLKNDVLNLIEKYEEKSGTTLEELKLSLNKGVKDIYNILEELIKEGQVYQVNNKYRLLL